VTSELPVSGGITATVIPPNKQGKISMVAASIRVTTRKKMDMCEDPLFFDNQNRYLDIDWLRKFDPESGTVLNSGTIKTSDGVKMVLELPMPDTLSEELDDPSLPLDIFKKFDVEARLEYEADFFGIKVQAAPGEDRTSSVKCTISVGNESGDMSLIDTGQAPVPPPPPPPPGKGKGNPPVPPPPKGKPPFSPPPNK
jgi:hypothetical protein